MEGVEDAHLDKEIDLQGVHWDFDRSIPQEIQSGTEIVPVTDF